MPRSPQACVAWSFLAVFFSAGASGQCLPVWVKLTPATSPSPRFSPVMATNGNDAIMFGGLGQNGITGDLWRWDGTNWTLITTNNALARSNAAAITIIPPGGGLPATLIYGGVNPSLAPLGDLLTWSPATGLITLTADMGIGARFNHGWCGATDENFHNLLIGGGDCGGMFATGHRVTLGGNVAVPPPASPANFYARSNFASAWDSLRGRAIVVGGNIGASPCTAPTYDPSLTVRSWSPDSGWSDLGGADEFLTANHAAAFSPKDALVVFGGETQAYPSPNGLRNRTRFSTDGGKTWDLFDFAANGPSARRAVNNLVWVPGAEHFVLFGGHDGGANNSGFLGDTWVLTYRAVVTEAPANRTSCPDNDGTFAARFAAPSETTFDWQFRWLDADTGFDSGWVGVPGAETCNSPLNLVINGKNIATVRNVCSEFLRLRRGPDMALADRVLLRRRAQSPCASLVISPEAEWSLTADLNNDGIVNTADLVNFLARFGQSNSPGAPILLADCNGDGAVNTPDLVFFLGRFGRSCD